MKSLLETKERRSRKRRIRRGKKLSLYVTHKSTKTNVIRLKFDIVHKLSRLKLK